MSQEANMRAETGGDVQLLHAVVLSAELLRSAVEMGIGADADHQRVRRRPRHRGLVDQKRLRHRLLPPKCR
jgi:hypothetical protein